MEVLGCRRPTRALHQLEAWIERDERVEAAANAATETIRHRDLLHGQHLRLETIVANGDLAISLSAAPLPVR
jgi:hypothetical protein